MALPEGLELLVRTNIALLRYHNTPLTKLRVSWFLSNIGEFSTGSAVYAICPGPGELMIAKASYNSDSNGKVIVNSTLVTPRFTRIVLNTGVGFDIYSSASNFPEVDFTEVLFKEYVARVVEINGKA